MKTPLRRARREGVRRGVLLLVFLLAPAAACVVGPDRPIREERHDPRAEAMVDPAYYAALVALAEHHAWRAESLLAPALADSARRTAWVLLLAAEAAAETEQWERVDTLLDAGPLDDARAEVPARLLLARGALERNLPREALTHARIADSLTRKGEEQGRALVFLARSHERLGSRDSARVAYTRAATALRPVGDWLALRAAALTRDSAGRAKQYDRIRTPTAKLHALYAEAQLLERTGRARGAIALYEKADEPVHAMRLRAAVASGPVEREQARREVIEYIEKHMGTMDARFGIEILDAGRYRLTADEEILVARSAVEHGPLSRARAALDRAFAIRAATPDERLFQIAVLAETGPASRRQAEQLLARIKKPAPHAGRAALERAKLIRRRGATATARTLLRDVVRLYPDDTAAAAGALLVLGEMAIDDRRDPAARETYLSLARKYPMSEHAPRARFEAGLLAFGARLYRAAALELDSLIELHPESAELAAASYWSGRAHAALKDSVSARQRWRDVLVIADPMSWYSAQASRRLGLEPWTPDEMPETFATIQGIEEALARIALLERLGMDVEARRELDGLSASADSSAERAMAVGNVFRRRGNIGGDGARPASDRARGHRREGLSPDLPDRRGEHHRHRSHRAESRPGARRGGDPAGVELRAAGDLSRRCARADAGDAVGRQGARPGREDQAVEPGPPLRPERQHPARGRTPSLVHPPLRAPGDGARRLQRRSEPGHAMVIAPGRKGPRHVRRADPVRRDGALRADRAPLARHVRRVVRLGPRGRQG